ncbi:unnamed protein product, partial [Rotaria socialis]
MPTHIQHHQAPNQMPNIFYRQPSQAPQQAMYNNFIQPQPPPPPNQVAPGYYQMQQQAPPPPPSLNPQQQRISQPNHSAQLNKRQALMLQQRTAQQNNSQLQLHMSMNLTLPQ